MSTAEAIIESVVDIEGGFVDDPDDSGGATKFGITEEFARAAGYQGKMRDLTHEQAVGLYLAGVWAPLQLNAILPTSEAIATELFDTGVNCGIARAGSFFQRCLNVMNRRGRDYADILVDGAIGPATLATYDAFRQVRGREGEAVLYKALNALQGAFYIELAERREKDERFVYGWLLHRVT